MKSTIIFMVLVNNVQNSVPDVTLPSEQPHVPLVINIKRESLMMDTVKTVKKDTPRKMMVTEDVLK